uniref:uncharacterized protein LOC120343196 n=1 Tax=Styela clava TaxID=7725 RepID=UPI001939FB55|nr:uncharacterized protein LOC120343196 [Styela clava]
MANRKPKCQEQDNPAIYPECDPAVQDCPGGNEAVDRENTMKEEHKINEELRDFQEYIRSVQEHEIFQQHESYLTPDDKREIINKCCDVIQFLTEISENFNIKQVQAKRLGFEDFVCSVLHRLQHRAQLVGDREQENKRNESIQSFQKYIRSVQTYEIFETLESVLTPYNKDEVNKRCHELDKMLSDNQRKLDIKDIESERRELEDFIKILMNSLQSKDQEEKGRQEQELRVVIRSFRNYIRSVQQHEVFKQYQRFISPEDRNKINRKCVALEKFLNDKVIAELEMKRKEEQEHNKAIREFEQYVHSVETHSIFGDYQTFLSPDEKEAIKVECIRSKEFLSSNSEKLDIKEIQIEKEKFENNVESVLEILQQASALKSMFFTNPKPMNFLEFLFATSYGLDIIEGLISGHSKKQLNMVQLSKNQHERNHKSSKIQSFDFFIQIAKLEKRREQELNEAMKNFQQHIQSVQNLEVFAEYETFLSSDDKKDVDDKCFGMNAFLTTHPFLDMKKQREQLEKKNETIQHFLQSIRSVESHAEFKDAVIFLTSDDKSEINAKCFAMKEILSNNEEKLSVEQIQDVKVEFDDFVASIVTKLKDRQQDQAQKLEEAIQNFQSYIQSVQELKEFDQYETYLTSTDINGIHAECIATQTFINENIENLHFKQIENKRAEFESFIQSFVTKLQKKAQVVISL